MKIGAKAIAKQGYHSFKTGEEIKFIGIVEGMVYSKNTTLYNFVNDNGVSQHLEKQEFDLMK